MLFFQSIEFITCAYCLLNNKLDMPLLFWVHLLSVCSKVLMQQRIILLKDSYGLSKS